MNKRIAALTVAAASVLGGASLVGSPAHADNGRTETIVRGTCAASPCTISTIGGTVVVARTGPTTVRLVSITPKAGWRVAKSSAGPIEASVTLKNGATEVRVEANVDNGSLAKKVRVRVG